MAQALGSRVSNPDAAQWRTGLHVQTQAPSNSSPATAPPVRSVLTIRNKTFCFNRRSREVPHNDRHMEVTSILSALSHKPPHQLVGKQGGLPPKWDQTSGQTLFRLLVWGHARDYKWLPSFHQWKSPGLQTLSLEKAQLPHGFEYLCTFLRTSAPS